MRFSPTRGVIARQVVIYSDPEKTRDLARIPRLRFEVDRGKALGLSAKELSQFIQARWKEPHDAER